MIIACTHLKFWSHVTYNCADTAHNLSKLHQMLNISNHGCCRINAKYYHLVINYAQWKLRMLVRVCLVVGSGELTSTTTVVVY